MTNDICRTLQDKDEILDVIVRSARAADQPDGAEATLRAVFHPGATDEHAGMYGGTMEEFIPKMLEMRKVFTFTQHALSNFSIKLAGEVADTECYVTATHGYLKDGVEFHWLVGARYVDRLERRNGTWRIAKRVTYMDWNRVVQVNSTLPKPF